MRILRPWLVASAAGLSLGVLLLEFSPASSADESSYAETAPRAAAQETGLVDALIPDPFDPASFTDSPDAPQPAPVIQTSTPPADESDLAE